MMFEFPDETLVVPQGEVISAEATLDLSGRVAVLAQLGNPAAKSFAEITERHVGQILTVSVCGEKMMEGVLQTAMPLGTLMFSGPPTTEVADQIVASLTAGRCDPAPRS
jgi:preprotein translocase subunit SecD